MVDKKPELEADDAADLALGLIPLRATTGRRLTVLSFASAAVIGAFTIVTAMKLSELSSRADQLIEQKVSAEAATKKAQVELEELTKSSAKTRAELVKLEADKKALAGQVAEAQLRLRSLVVAQGDVKDATAEALAALPQSTFEPAMNGTTQLVSEAEKLKVFETQFWLAADTANGEKIEAVKFTLDPTLYRRSQPETPATPTTKTAPLRVLGECRSRVKVLVTLAGGRQVELSHDWCGSKRGTPDK